MRALVAVTAVSLSGCASLAALMHPAVPRPVAPDQVNPEFKDREGAEAGPEPAPTANASNPAQPASVPFYLQAPVVIEVPAPKPKLKSFRKKKPKATPPLKLPPGVLPGQQPPPPPPCPTPAKETTT